MQEELDELRESIAEIDLGLLELLRRRMEVSAAVGRLKAAAGLPVVVREVENRVLVRARRQAEACGVSEESMEAIFQAIVRGSVERQHRVGAVERARRGSTVLIVGGAGGMGGWFRRFLGEVGHRVHACDPTWRSLPAASGRYAGLAEIPSLDVYDYVLVSVPLDRTPEVLDELAARRGASTVIEIASIKSHLAGALGRLAAAGVPAVCLHPMFGPGKPSYEPLTFVHAFREEEEEEARRAEVLLRHPYTRLVPIPFARHDQLMGWVLGLAHFTGILFGTALSEAALPARELRACASTTFLRQAATARSVLSEDPDLYLDIQRLNPHRQNVYRAVRNAVDRLVEAVEAEDRQSFHRLLETAREAVTGQDGAA